MPTPPVLSLSPLSHSPLNLGPSHNQIHLDVRLYTINILLTISIIPVQHTSIHTASRCRCLKCDCKHGLHQGGAPVSPAQKYPWAQVALHGGAVHVAQTHPTPRHLRLGVPLVPCAGQGVLYQLLDEIPGLLFLQLGNLQVFSLNASSCEYLISVAGLLDGCEHNLYPFMRRCRLATNGGRVLAC